MLNRRRIFPHKTKSDILSGLFILSLILAPHLNVCAQAGTPYSFLVAGHAYGSHEGENIGLHPALLNSLESGFDSTAAFIIFTGDIVNNSTVESWQQVENELAGIALPYYYVMGNHDGNSTGYEVFEEKFGGTWYSFSLGSELFIVLNSTLEEKSISSDQLEFLEEQIGQAGDTIQNIFIFFHEVLWNSYEKYAEVMSNNRSRYDDMVGYSNYWEEVHPLLNEHPGLKFYVISGDVGGRPDAIAAFYDRWGQITFLASGMGEVPDENYLLVKVHSPDSVGFKLVALDSNLTLPGIEYYSIPAAPSAITGPDSLPPGGGTYEYVATAVFNADYYRWELPEGTSGSSTTANIEITFDPGYEQDSILVKAVKDGFGESPATSLPVRVINPSGTLEETILPSPRIELLESSDRFAFRIRGLDQGPASVRISDLCGRISWSAKIVSMDGSVLCQIEKHTLPTGIFLLSVSTSSQHITRKFIAR